MSTVHSAAAEAGRQRPPGAAESGRHMAAAARDFVDGVTQLATLELRYSLRSALGALIAALLLAAVAFAAWALLLVMLSLGLVGAGLSWFWSLVVVSVVNVGVAASLWIAAQRFIRQVGLDATRRALGLTKEAGVDGRSPQSDTPR